MPAALTIEDSCPEQAAMPASGPDEIVSLSMNLSSRGQTY